MPSHEGGDRVGVARSYSTPDDQWHTIWRTLANPGEYSLGNLHGATVNSAENLGA